jgi:L-histidine Nalpha-methyltransferase
MERTTRTSLGRIDVARVISAVPSIEDCAALREGLLRPLPEISPRYFYDDVGSELFERITQLPVYYQTRTEISILERYAASIVAAAAPRRIIELGSGAGRKIRLLLDAWGIASRSGTCTMLDINERFVRRSIDRLHADYPGCRFDGVVGDFVKDLARLGPPGHRLFVFFAGTIGNLYPAERADFLRKLAAGMDDSDAFLVGVDLVKDRSRLEAAYDDPQGVTAMFNRNMLHVLNRSFGGDFVPERFAHRALYDEDQAWIEMRLVATEPSRVTLRSLDLDLEFASGSELRTEISCKFTRDSLAQSAAAAGFEVDGWTTDPEQLFALALLRKRGS